MKIDKKIMKIAGLDYAVSIWGSGKIIFALHGFSESSSTWQKLSLTGYKIVAIDLLGHGSSAKPDTLAPYKLDQVLSDLHLLFTQFADEKPFSLLGYSMGGRLALRYCLAYPSAPVEKLILESTGPGIFSISDREKRQFTDEELAQKILLNGSEWFANFWGNLSLFNSQKKLSVKIQKEIWQRRANNSPLALAQTLRGTGQGQLDYIGDKISLVNPEILYLSGDLDEKYSNIAKEIFAPNSNVTWIPVAGSGHNIHLENPALYQKILEEFLA